MSDVEFEEEQLATTPLYKSRVIFGEAAVPGMARFLIKIGLAKTERQAGFMLLGTTILFFAASIFVLVYFVFGSGPRNSPPTILQDRIQEFNPLPEPTR